LDFLCEIYKKLVTLAGRIYRLQNDVTSVRKWQNIEATTNARKSSTDEFGDETQLKNMPQTQTLPAPDS
jgi:hypothetical protein